jgi:hypothetical protein
MKLGRRALLKASLGLTQYGLLSKLGSPSIARAQTFSGPDKLLTLFLPGGWMSPWAFVPYTAAQVSAVIPPPLIQNGEPIYFSPSQVVNLDGTSGSGAIPSLRVAKLWNQTALSAGMPDPRTGGATSPNGWSWVQHQLWNDAMVVHGVDQMTVAHVGGTVSALCGVASSEFKSPALQAWAADGLFARFPDRPLPSVWISGPAPESLALRTEVAPARITQLSDIQFLYSDRFNQPWQNLRAKDINATIPPLNFDGTTGPNGFVLNPIEDRVARRLRGMRGKLNPASEGVLQQLYDGLSGVSKVLAKDVTAIVQTTQGLQYTPKPFWAPASGGQFGIDVPMFRGDTGSTWNADFDLALRLLKSNTCSSVAVGCRAPSQQSFDNGHAEGHRVQFAEVRGIFEVIGRLLGEMKATPGAQAGKSLLDETLVVVLSDFARTYPNSGPTSDHWAANSVIFAGGGLQTNRMLGGYDIQDPNAVGYSGLPLPIQEVGGMVTRVPRSGDVVGTALAVLGINGVRISGGNGEILGVRQGT